VDFIYLFIFNLKYSGIIKEIIEVLYSISLKVSSQDYQRVHILWQICSCRIGMKMQKTLFYENA